MYEIFNQTWQPSAMKPSVRGKSTVSKTLWKEAYHEINDLIKYFLLVLKESIFSGKY